MDAPAPCRSNAQLRDAIETLYRVFAAPPPAAIEGCPCCLATRGVDILLTTFLRRLTGQALWRYVSGAFLTVGGEQDFCYLLPRILEVSTSDPGNANDPEIVLGKLRLANWRSWTPDEQRVIEAFVDAWFEQALADDHAEDGWIGTDTESVLCGAARAGMALDRWLARLSEPDAAPVLADIRNRFPGEISPFWEDAPAGLRALSTVLTHGAA